MKEAATGLLSPKSPVKFSPEAITKFRSKVDTNGPVPDQSNPHYTGLGRCHNWNAGLYSTGYGQTYLDGRPISAHRAAAIIAGFPLPKGMQVHHACDNKKCVNPDHLWVGTQKENIADKMAKGREARGDRSGSRLHPERLKRGDQNGSRLYPERLVRGEDNFQAKLTAENVREIRRRYIPWVVSCSKLGNEYGVSAAIISRVVRREIWRHVA